LTWLLPVHGELPETVTHWSTPVSFVKENGTNFSLGPALPGHALALSHDGAIPFWMRAPACDTTEVVVSPQNGPSGMSAWELEEAPHTATVSAHAARPRCTVNPIGGIPFV
jgi:hypothetical protein